MASGVMSILPFYGNKPNLPSIQPNPLPSSLPPSVPTTPNFQDIFKSLNNPNRQIGGNENFQKGIQAAQPFNGISPETQQILDMIRQNQQYSQAQGVSQAQSLAAKRGITGSSTEQFGTQEAVGQASRAAQDAQANVLLENLKRNQALKDLQAQGFFNRANQEGSIGANLGINEANLTSDEIASGRNLDFQNRSLALQGLLGQQGIDVARQNIGAQQDINKQNAMYGLIGQIGGAATPYALNSLFGGGGGGGGGLFGGGSAATAAAPYAGMGGTVGGAPLIGPAAGPATGLAGFAGAHPGIALAGAGLGAMALANYGQKVGGDVGAFFANPIGAQLNLAKSALSKGGNAVSNVASSVTNAVSKVFPF